MLYRRMKKASSDLSILGFGCMRLPVTKDHHVDEPQATKMLRYAMEGGVNYIDTAYPYHNGESELFLGRALQGGYRDRAYLATKLPGWLVKSHADMDRFLNEQLKRLQTDHIDFYMIHGITKSLWESLRVLEVTRFLDRALEDGRIRYAGFSYHDDLELFKEVVDAYDWTFCQIQYNFMDELNQAGTEGLKYAASRDLGIVIMEPLRGGMLTQNIPAIDGIWQKAPVQRSLPEWALRWVWNVPEVTVVLSGMSSLEQMEQNISYAEQGLPGSLSPGELALFKEAEIEYKDRIKVPCTHCGYCMPCPADVNIAECFEMYNQGYMFDSQKIARNNYKIVLGGFLTPTPGLASQCTGCGDCEDKCPQHIQIQENLEKVVAYFGC